MDTKIQETTTTEIVEKDNLVKPFSLTVAELNEQVENRTFKNIDKLKKVYHTDHFNEMVIDLLGKGSILKSESVPDVQLAIMLLQIGFGIADKDPEHIHNKLLVKFLEDTKNVGILEEFNKYWNDDPLKAKIRYVSAIRIYNATNEICTLQIMKLKGRATKLVTLPTEKTLTRKPETEISFNVVQAEKLNWNSFVFKLRG